ncbi:MAG: hypothetical protein GX285_01615 [Clostridiales bacterium]|nr:hypothetical protein [Clostridiales bacterium]
MNQVNYGVMLYAQEIARSWKKIYSFFLIDENLEKFKKWHLEKYGREADVSNFPV